MREMMGFNFCSFMRIRRVGVNPILGVSIIVIKK